MQQIKDMAMLDWKNRKNDLRGRVDDSVDDVRSYLGGLWLSRALGGLSTRIVSLTVTEKGYYLDVASGKLQLQAPPVAARCHEIGEDLDDLIGIDAQHCRTQHLAIIAIDDDADAPGQFAFLLGAAHVLHVVFRDQDAAPSDGA